MFMVGAGNWTREAKARVLYYSASLHMYCALNICANCKQYSRHYTKQHKNNELSLLQQHGRIATTISHTSRNR